VPSVHFVSIPRHVLALRDLLLEWSLDHHLLLIGNQGVGKNKLADRLLELLDAEREYVQLHRDTTVQALTLAPTLRDGVVVWADSPLVAAARSGRVLVVDEADKAPLEVVCVLKALASVDSTHWFGPRPPNFRTLYLGQIEVDSADFWTNRLLSSSSRSTAEKLASKLSRTITLKSG